MAVPAYPDAVGHILVIALLALLVLLVVGGLTGRVQARSCCAVADPRLDLRMRAAFDDDNDGRPSRPA